MSVSYPLSPSNCVLLASQLPLEVKFVVLKEVMVNFLNSKRDRMRYRSNKCHDMIAQFVSMLGYNTDLDMILSMVVQELNLDSSIFSSPHFERFARFVIKRSLQLKSLQIEPLFKDPTFYNSPEIICLLEFHCQTVIYLLII
ncbi:unnamed protein product [Ambrosiozyma monospora]|uniref:Unnamed protein product n=1 Tax=Ambrosiozyma monospora TaxID=43982 RepID=A0ACB5ST68_AMBMO|nr:unnamed protein product [Ambrosiozyma monospora]